MPTAPAMREAEGPLLEMAGLVVAVEEVVGVVPPWYYWQCMSCPVPRYCACREVVVVVEEEGLPAASLAAAAAASLDAATASAAAVAEEVAVGTAVPDCALALAPDPDFDPDPALEPAFDSPLG